jgi:putative dimethyl sulfoxide reductase chaperone
LNAEGVILQKQQRIFIYAFLSRLFSDQLDASYVKELKKNPELLETIGQESFEYIANTSEEQLLKELNIDFTSMFVMNAQPIESFVLDAKQDTLVGLQNPVMQFYFEHGYDVDMNQTSIMAPDHLSIELGFMQTLVFRDELPVQLEFLQKHLVRWSLPFFMGMKVMAETPFFRDVCDFYVEFLVADMDFIISELS